MVRHLLLVVMATSAVFHGDGVNRRHHDTGVPHGSVLQSTEALSDTPHRRHSRRGVGSAGGRGGGGVVPRGRATNLSRITPAQQNNTEVLAQVGGSVTIKCYTHLLGDEMVTWLKRDEDHLLTAGGQVYSSDTRFSVAHIKHQDLWELSLRDVRLSDAGLYECQLTTHPPTSLFFTLKVVEARAFIESYPEINFHLGHTLRLRCTVEQATEPPLYIFWYHNGSMVNYYPNKPVGIHKHRYSSTLSIKNITWTHAGMYRCEPHLATPASITVRVSGQPAAMHIEGNNVVVEEDTFPLGSANRDVPLSLFLVAITLIVLLEKW